MKKTRHCILCVACLALGMLLVSGCAKRTEEPPVQSATQMQTELSEPEELNLPEPETVLPDPEPAPEPKPEPPVAVPARQFLLAAGQAVVYETMDAAQSYQRLQRHMELPNGDTVTMGRVRGVAGETAVFGWQSEQEGSISYYDRQSGAWQNQNFAEGEIHSGLVLLELKDGGSCLIYTPRTYLCGENETLVYLPENDGAVRISSTDGRWYISLVGFLAEGDCVCDYTLVRSDDVLLDLAVGNSASLWAGYTLDGDGKWCYDGFYWPCPYNYVPTGEGYLYRCPASYLVKSFAYVANTFRAADDLSVAMLDTLCQMQNELGYWPTVPQSEWLYADYGIGGGFYDTRFNTDLIEIYYKVYSRTGGDAFRRTMEQYAAFYTEFASEHHFETQNGGWLVEDYWHCGGGSATHCSLNHLLAECIALYHLSDALQQSELAQLADRLLQSVKDTADHWIMEDGNLHYCVSPDGIYGKQDYPYLTYNDLFDLQALLKLRNGEEDADLARLMQAKRRWMDQNGITGYKK